jgi:HlyD family secretion protein
VKKWLIIGLVALAAAGGGGWYYWTKVATAEVKAPAFTLEKVIRGPLRVTVASTGRVVSNLDVDIKCKAGGEIIALLYDISDFVSQGDILVELDPVDEQRNVTKAEIALSASKARQSIAESNLKIAEETLATERLRCTAALTSAEVRAKDARAKANRMKDLLASQLASPEEAETAETAAVSAAADLENAQVRLGELKTQEGALELKRQDVKVAQTQVQSDEVSLAIQKDRLADIKVASKMQGFVTQRPVQLGQIIASAISNVGGGTTILTLSDLSHIFVLASVDESDIGRVAVGQPVIITADAYKELGFRGKVVRISKRGVNSNNVVTFEVKIEVLTKDGLTEATTNPSAASGPARRVRPEGRPGADSRPTTTSKPARNKGEKGGRDKSGSSKVFGEDFPVGDRSLLMPEMTANVTIIVSDKKDIITVPSEALVRKDSESFATVVTDQGAAEEKPVEVGITDGSRTEIVGGLSEGDTIQVRAGGGGKWAQGNRPPNPGAMMGGGGRGR